MNHDSLENTWSPVSERGTDLPEPDGLLAVPGVVPVHGVALPVGQVHLLHATQHHLGETELQGHAHSMVTATNPQHCGDVSHRRLVLSYPRLLHAENRVSVLQEKHERC